MLWVYWHSFPRSSFSAWLPFYNLQSAKCLAACLFLYNSLPLCTLESFLPESNRKSPAHISSASSTLELGIWQCLAVYWKFIDFPLKSPRGLPPWSRIREWLVSKWRGKVGWIVERGKELEQWLGGRAQGDRISLSAALFPPLSSEAEQEKRGLVGKTEFKPELSGDPDSGFRNSVPNGQCHREVSIQKIHCFPFV